MKIFALKSNFINSLSGLYPSEEIESFFSILAQEYLKLSRIEIVLNREEVVSSENIEKIDNALIRLKSFEPIQYIIGETEFFGIPFRVTPSTLIPRPETEELVQLILDEVSNVDAKTEALDLLDIGTGSGCIAISLAKSLPKANVSAMDISSEALKVAKENAEINQVYIDFSECDILTTKSLPKKYDIIVSNPPYVRELEKEMMQPNVLRHEPDLALFVKDSDPLLFYRKISILAKTHLKPNGQLFFEINEYLGVDLIELLSDLGFQKIEIIKDIFEKDRMLKCSL